MMATAAAPTFSISQTATNRPPQRPATTTHTGTLASSNHPAAVPTNRCSAVVAAAMTEQHKQNHRVVLEIGPLYRYRSNDS
jgi:hypothetical protein